MLFLQSLPPQSKFQVISWGTRYNAMTIRGNSSATIAYTPENV